jgi:hypothetical protein
MGECPLKKPGLFIMLALCTFIQVMSLFPKIEMPADE